MKTEHVHSNNDTLLLARVLLETCGVQTKMHTNTLVAIYRRAMNGIRREHDVYIYQDLSDTFEQVLNDRRLNGSQLHDDVR